VRGERDRTQRYLRSRCCYLPVALTKARGTRNPSNSLLIISRALIRLRKGGLEQHDENCGTKGSNPVPSSAESAANLTFAWMGTLSGFDTPAVSAPFFAAGTRTNSDAADPLSLNHYGSTYRFIDSRDTFSEGHPVVSPASAMRR
jgi:hypothetical protein